jgi:hypothetical protein
VRENRVIAGIAYNRWPSLNARINKSPHIEMFADISKRVRGPLSISRPVTPCAVTRPVTDVTALSGGRGVV